MDDPGTIHSVEGRDPKKVGEINAALRSLPGPEPQAKGIEQAPEGARQTVAPLQGEDEELLFGPTMRPDVPANRGINTSGKVPPPEVMRRYLGAMVEAAKDPNAPEELHAFLRLLNYHLGG